MKFKHLLKSKYPEQSDMHKKISSTHTCLIYNQCVENEFSHLSFSQAQSISQNVLTVHVSTHTQASQIKLYEADLIEYINHRITEDMVPVSRINIRIQS